MASHGKVLVVGAGIAGLSTAWALTRRGFSVEVFEQGPIPNPKASSYDEHRITRHAYGSMSGYARLMPGAFASYERMFADIGTRHLDIRPLVVLERGATTWTEAALGDLDALGVSWRDIPPDEMVDRLPMIRTQGLTRAIETSGSGVLFPIRILTDLTLYLGSHGVAFHPMTFVTEIDPEEGQVRTERRSFAGDFVVVAAGAWAYRLVSELENASVPSRQAAIFLESPPEFAAAWADAPIILDLGASSGTYTLPPRPGTRLKVGDHSFTRKGDPDSDRLATDGDVERLMQAARLAYRDFDRYRILERKACFYTVTQDERFIVRHIGSKAIVQCACSGHGFKFGALMGEGVARAIAGEISRYELADWAAGLS
jgi:glycine/D-amino acid oxidase-like deaminating enzyme